MKNVGVYPDYRLSMGKQAHMRRPRVSSTCNVDDIEKISSEIVLKKRISLTLLSLFFPFIIALYLLASNMDVNKSYFIAFATIYALYYLGYSIWACSTHCPACGHTMSKKYLFIMPSLTCSHCGHDLKNPLKFHE